MEAAGKRDYMVVFNGSMDFEKIRNAMIDGIIMPNEGITQHYLDTVGRNYRLPVVSASYGNAEGFSRAVPRVEIDMVRVMELAVRALRENGHRRIALGMPYPFSSMDARRLSFCSLMKEVYGDRLKEYYIGVHREDMAGDSRILSFLEDERREDGMQLMEEDFSGKVSWRQGCLRKEGWMPRRWWLLTMNLRWGCARPFIPWGCGCRRIFLS